MKKGMSGKNSLYKFLDERGVLSSGTDEEIKKVKNDYWRIYKREWRRAFRRKNKSITIFFDKEEYAIISKSSSQYKRSKVRFLKECAFAYLDKQFVIPDISEVRRISQTLALMYNYIKDSVEEKNITQDRGDTIIEKITSLEKEVLVILRHPKLIEEKIIEIISCKARTKSDFINLLNSITENGT